MPAHFGAWQSSLRSFGADISEAQFYALGGMPSDEIIRLLNQENGYTLDVAQTHVDKERRYAEAAHVPSPRSRPWRTSPAPILDGRRWQWHQEVSARIVTADTRGDGPESCCSRSRRHGG